MDLIIRRIYSFLLMVCTHINWLVWYILNAKKINEVCLNIDNWNKEIPSFSNKFPSLNRNIFIKNYEYWIHWESKMDIREKEVFNEYNPIVLIEEDAYLYFSIQEKEVSIIYYYFYFPDSKWITINLFDKLEHFGTYLSMSDATSEKLISYIQFKIHEVVDSLIRNNPEEDHSKYSKVVVDELGIRFTLKNIEELNGSKV